LTAYIPRGIVEDTYSEFTNYDPGNLGSVPDFKNCITEDSTLFNRGIGILLRLSEEEDEIVSKSILIDFLQAYFKAGGALYNDKVTLGSYRNASTVKEYLHEYNNTEI